MEPEPVPRVLIVTTAFAPGALAGAQRPTQLVRRIGEHGWSAAVLTIPGACYSYEDPSLLSMVPSNVPVERVPCGSFWNHSHRWRQAPSKQARAAGYLQRVAARATGSWLPVDEFYPWARRATSTGVGLVERLGVDLIWATAPAWSAHVLAHRISRRAGVPFVADFRDVCAAAPGGGSNPQERAANRAERAMLRDAAGVTYVAPGQFALLEEKHGGLASMPRELAYNWFDAADARATTPKEFDRPILLNGGILYGGTRRVDDLMKALAADEGGDLQFLSLTPPGNDWDYLSTLRERFGLAERLAIRAPFPRPEFLGACRGAEILLLAVGRDEGSLVHAGAIPAKLFNYLAARRPILVTGPPGCEVGAIVERLNRGIFAADDDAAAIARAIARLRARQGAAGPLDLSEGSAAEFEASRAVPHLCGFFDAVLAGRVA
ncbi:MAG: hypothetical protein JRH10_16590, partial [Deltaproteobacteria bacterium]|nr:hypothetical protein [Deltaproteobacteria bacterium]